MTLSLGRAAMQRIGALVLVATAVLMVLALPTVAQAQSVPGSTVTASGTASAPQSAAFTMTNNASANAVVAYRIGTGGALIPSGTYATRGAGTGASLADQGSLVVTPDHRWLLVVDAGSNEITLFHVNGVGSSSHLLSYSDRVASGGVMPVSLTVHGTIVYALNDGNATVSGDIAGFYLTPSGLLLPLPGSHRALSSAAPTGAAEIAFNPAGTALVVAEKATNLLDVYAVNSRGYASAVATTTSNGTTPYGFAFTPNGVPVVSDAASGALTSYALTASGGLSVISGTVGDNQSAPCWVVIAGGGRLAYTTNAHSNSISSYLVARSGALTLATSVAGSTGAAPTDLALTASGHFLLVYDAGAGEIDEFAIGSGGVLSETTSVYGLPLTAEGLAAF